MPRTFRIERIGAFGNECAVRIDHGAQQREFMVMDHCTRPYHGKCTEVTLDVTLP